MRRAFSDRGSRFTAAVSLALGLLSIPLAFPVAPFKLPAADFYVVRPLVPLVAIALGLASRRRARPRTSRGLGRIGAVLGAIGLGLYVLLFALISGMSDG
jgi:hypothetical protein